MLRSSEMFESEASIVYKNVLSLLKIASLSFFGELQIKNCFKKQFSLCSDLFSISENNCFRKQFLFSSLQRNDQKAIFRSENTFFFVNDARFTRKHFWASKHWFWPMPNLLGHPVSWPKNWDFVSVCKYVRNRPWL